MRGVSSADPSDLAFAYRVPANPYAPQPGDWATVVRQTRVRVGDVLELSMRETTAGGEIVSDGTNHRWEVIAVEAIDNLGERAVVHRKGAPKAIWDGALVVRPVKAHR